MCITIHKQDPPQRSTSAVPFHYSGVVMTTGTYSNNNCCAASDCTVYLATIYIWVILYLCAGVTIKVTNKNGI